MFCCYCQRDAKRPHRCDGYRCHRLAPAAEQPVIPADANGSLRQDHRERRALAVRDLSQDG